MVNIRLRVKAASDNMSCHVGKSHNGEVHQLLWSAFCTNIDEKIFSSSPFSPHIREVIVKNRKMCKQFCVCGRVFWMVKKCKKFRFLLSGTAAEFELSRKDQYP